METKKITMPEWAVKGRKVTVVEQQKISGHLIKDKEMNATITKVGERTITVMMDDDNDKAYMKLMSHGFSFYLSRYTGASVKRVVGIGWTIEVLPGRKLNYTSK
jgi:hypothetical protein